MALKDAHELKDDSGQRPEQFLNFPSAETELSKFFWSRD
jgi:hypothetical protein